MFNQIQYAQTQSTQAQECLSCQVPALPKDSRLWRICPDFLNKHQQLILCNSCSYQIREHMEFKNSSKCLFCKTAFANIESVTQDPQNTNGALAHSLGLNPEKLGMNQQGSIVNTAEDTLRFSLNSFLMS